MRVLVTGATGCLGMRLAGDLLAQGADVLAQGRDAAALAGLRQAGARVIAADLRDGLPDSALRGVDVVYHCAALSSAWGPPALFHAVNVAATARLVDQARGAGRFVFAASPSIYADGTDRLDLAEDAPLPARFPSPYAASKFLSERLVLAADNPAGLRTIALRPRAIYGIGDRSLLPRLLAAIRRGRVPLINGGQSLIDITHVADAARAMICAGQAATGGQAYNVTSGRAYRFTDLLEAVCALNGARPTRIPLSYATAMTIAKTLEALHRRFAPAREPVLTCQAVSSLGRSLTLDIARARRDLGYSPQVTLEQGIRDYADVV